MGSGQSTSKKKQKERNRRSENREVNFEDFLILRAIGKGSLGKDEEDMFMVVDVLLGGDLRYHIQQEGQFSETRVCLYLCELALALDYLLSKCILHRDIKPDNILLDENGHAHITDFNTAIVLRNGELATSMSGTKPYMAPEVFDCALDRCLGYTFPADWWSLGVCCYEMLCGTRPYDIHSNTSLEEVHSLFQLTELQFPSSVSEWMRDLIKKLLTVDCSGRMNTLEHAKKHSYLATVDFSAIYEKNVKPTFIPSKDQLNCDPTFELEEMIIESKPLHKKKKRLSKRYSRRDPDDSSSSEEEPSPFQIGLASIQEQYIIYNREKELEK